jgi:thioredoxin 2
MVQAAGEPASVHVPCWNCFAVNRVARGRSADRPSCGRCKSALFSEAPIALDDASFDRYVQRSGVPVVVDFWAEWCGPCKMMAPQFAFAARAGSGRALFAKVDTEAAPRVAGRHGIRSIPTLIAFREGRELARQSGALSSQHILSWIAALPA